MHLGFAQLTLLTAAYAAYLYLSVTSSLFLLCLRIRDIRDSAYQEA